MSRIALCCFSVEGSRQPNRATPIRAPRDDAALRFFLFFSWNLPKRGADEKRQKRHPAVTFCDFLFGMALGPWHAYRQAVVVYCCIRLGPTPPHGIMYSVRHLPPRYLSMFSFSIRYPAPVMFRVDTSLLTPLFLFRFDPPTHLWLYLYLA